MHNPRFVSRLLVALSLLAAPSAFAQPRSPASSRVGRGAGAGRAVLDVLQQVESGARDSRYSHTTRVDAARGEFQFDCSGMAAWVLRRAAPQAEDAVLAVNEQRRPVASDYHDVIERAPTRAAAGAPWQRLTRVGDLRPGDVIAWRRPRSVASTNTGHVAFVVSAPERTARGDGWVIRVADSTAIPHEDDTRHGVRSHRSGYGQGTIVLTTDRADAPHSYGWFGRRTRLYFPTSIMMGRPLR